MLGELASLAAALIWAVSVTLFKLHGEKSDPVGVNIFKGLVAIVFFTASILAWRIPLPHSTREWLLLMASGFVGISIGDTAFFAALPRIGVAMTVVIQCLAPPVTGILAWIFLREVLSPMELLGLLVSTLGIAGFVWFDKSHDQQSPLVERPAGFGNSVKVAGIALAVLAALCQAGGSVLAKESLQATHPMAAAFVRLTGPVLLLWAFTLAIPKYRPALKSVVHDRRRAAWIALAAFLGTFLGLIFLAIGIKHSSVAVALAISSTYPVWTVPIGRLVLGEKYSKSAIICVLIAVCGVLLTVRW